MNTDTNRDYYEAPSQARLDYWRYMAAPRARVARVLGEVRKIAPGSLVDLGCGDGSLLAEIQRALPAIRLAGVDLSESQIANNRKRTPAIEWHAANLEEAVALTETYECVVASEVIEHLERPASLLRNAAVVAAPGASLLLTTQSGPVRETERRVGHVRHFTAAELEALLAEHGWTPVRVWNEGYPFHDLSKWWANRDADASMARFGGDEGYGWGERAICLALRAAFRLNSRSRGAQLYAVARRNV